MPEPLPFHIGPIEIVLDVGPQKVVSAGTPVVVRCSECGATSKSSVDSLPYLLERRDLVSLANRLSRWGCGSRGHGVPF